MEKLGKKPMAGRIESLFFGGEDLTRDNDKQKKIYIYTYTVYTIYQKASHSVALDVL